MTMRRSILVLLLVLLAAACSSSSNTADTPAPTRDNPGPNSTATDPGPNNTAGGPVTLQGALSLGTACVTLTGHAANQPTSRFQLELPGDHVTKSGSDISITGTDERTIHPTDVVYVAGQESGGSGPCGTKFRVEKLVAVVAG